MTAGKPDRSGLWAAIILWAMAIAGVALGGLDVADENPRKWLGHWICIIWAAIGWLPLLVFLRRAPQPPKDRQ